MIIKGTPIGEYRPTPLGSLEVMDSHIEMHSSGNPFVQYLYKDLMQKLAAYMHNNIRKDFDNIAVVDGLEGVGKSGWTWWLAYIFEPTFDFERQLTYGVDQLKKKLRRGDDKHSIFWLDEAYDIIGKRDWQEKNHKKFIGQLVKMRSRGWTLLMDIPRAGDADIYIRDHRAQYWITVEYGMEFDITGYHERGVFQLRLRSKKTGYWEHVGYGLFPPMPPEIEKIYKQYKEKYQEENLMEEDDEDSPGQKYKAKYENERKRLAKMIAKLRNMGYPIKDICEDLNITRGQYNHLMYLNNEGKGIDPDDEEEEA